MSNKSFFDKFIPKKDDSPKVKASKIVTIIAAAVLVVTVIILICLVIGEQRNKKLNDLVFASDLFKKVREVEREEK